MRLEDSHLTTSSGAPSYCEVQRYVSKQILRQRSHFWRRFVIYAIFFINRVKKNTKKTQWYHLQLFRPMKIGNSAGSEITHVNKQPNYG